MTPVSKQWNVLNFEPGMAIGRSTEPTESGNDWFVNPLEAPPPPLGTGEGSDWVGDPTGTWGFEYGRQDPAGTQFFLCPPGGSGVSRVDILPTSKGIRPVVLTSYFVLDDLEGRDWEYLVRMQPVAAHSGLYRFYCGRSSDGIGGAVALTVQGAFPSAYLEIGHWDDLLLSWQAFVTTIPLTSATEPILFRMIYNLAGNTVQVFVQGVYIGEFVACTYAPAATGSNYQVGLGVVDSGLAHRVYTSWQIGTHPHYGDLKPRAHAGMDRVSPIGRWMGFDGKHSVDQDGTGELTYSWKLVLAPSTSAFVYQASDGNVISPSVFESLSTTFHDPVTPLLVQFAIGDILMIRGVPYEIDSFVLPLVPGPCHQVRVKGILPAGYTGVFQVVLQSDVRGPGARVFSVEPDARGLYAAFLRVMDSDGYWSEPDFAVCNVIDDNVPLGVPLDMSWMWNYLGDFWKLAARKEWIHETWMAVTRLAGTTLQDAWNVDFDKSLATTQNVVARRWLMEHPSYYEQDPDATTFVDRRCTAFWLDSFDFTTMSTGATPLMVPWVITLRLFTEDGTLNLDIAVPGGTSWLDVPDLASTALAAAAVTESRWSLVHCSWRLVSRANTDLATPHLHEWYRLGFTSDSYVMDVTDDAGLFMPATPNYFVGPSPYLGERLSAAMVRLWIADPDNQVQPGDILDLAGRSFEIVGVKRTYPVDPSNVPVAPYVALDVEVTPDIPETGFSDLLFWCIPSYWTSPRTPWYDSGVTPGDLLFVETRPADESDANPVLLGIEVAGAGVRKIGTADYRAFYPTLSYRLNHARRHFYLAVPPNLLEMPRLQQDVDNPTWIMEEFKDYFVDNRRNGRFVVLDFRREPKGEMEAFSFYRDRAYVSFLQNWLWAEVGYFDNRKTVENNFGRMVNFFVEDFAESPDSNYLSVITNLWHAYSAGPTPENIDTASAIIGGFPYAEASGTILQIVENFVVGYSYAFVRDDDQSAIVRSYVFPTGKGLAINPETGVAYANGDHVERFTLLVQGQVLFNYLDDPDWWKSIRSSGLVSEVEKVHRFGLMFDINYLDPSLFGKIVDFVLDYKKTHTYPIVAGYTSEGEDIEIEDVCTQTAYVYLPTALWSYPVPPDLDVPRLGSGTRFEPIQQSDPDTEIHVRMKVSGYSDVRVRLVPSNVIGFAITPGPVPEFAWSVDGYFIPGVTRAAEMIPVLNTSLGPGDYIEAYLPPGAIYSIDNLDSPALRVDGRVPGTTPGATFKLVVGTTLGIVEAGFDATLTVVAGATSFDDIVNEINTNSALFTAALMGGVDPTVPPGWYGRLNVANFFGVEARNSGVYTFEIVVGAVLDLVEGANAAVLTVVAGVTTIRDVLAKINTTSAYFRATEVTSGFLVPTFDVPPWAPFGPTPADLVWGPVPVLTGSGVLVREAGWHDVNPRGKHQLRLDAAGSWMPSEGSTHNYPGVLDYTALLLDFAGPYTLLSANVGANVIDAVATSGNWARVTILDGAWPSYRFHDDTFGVPPPVYISTELECRKHWMVFFTAGVPPVYNCMAPIVGVESGIVPTGFGPGLGGPSTYVDVLLPAGVTVPPGAGDSFVIFEGMPDRTLMGFRIPTADTYLSPEFMINQVLAVNPGAPPAPPQYQIQVAPPYFFAAVLGPHLLLPNEDHFLFFDTAGRLATMAKLISVDNGVQGDLATVELVPNAVSHPPSPGYCFVVLRNPSFSWSGDVDEYENVHLGMRSLGFERGPFRGTIDLT